MSDKRIASDKGFGFIDAGEDLSAFSKGAQPKSPKDTQPGEMYQFITEPGVLYVPAGSTQRPEWATELITEIRALGSAVHELTSAVSGSKSLAALDVRDQPREQTLLQVEDLLRQANRELYPSEIAEQLGLDYEAVLQALEGLRAKGTAAPSESQ